LLNSFVFSDARFAWRIFAVRPGVAALIVFVRGVAVRVALS